MVAAFVVSVAYGVMLLVAFEPEVQGLELGELLGRTDDTRAFLLADLLFPLLYGLAFPIAAWRLGRSLTGGRPPWFFVVAGFALAIGALFDLAENILLLAAVDAESTGLVDAAHVSAIPKLVAAGVGDLLALAVLARAILALRQPQEAESRAHDPSRS